MSSVSQQDNAPCPICHSSFCCCLEHLFPEQVAFHNRYKQVQAEPLHGAYQPGQAEPSHHRCKNGQAEPQGKLGPESLSQESCSWPHGGLLPKGAAPEPTPQNTPVAEGQTKRASLLEAASNILIGFWVSVGANMLVLPYFKNPGVFREAFTIGLIFTVISFFRSYLLRRLFNLFHIRQNRRSPWKP